MGAGQGGTGRGRVVGSELNYAVGVCAVGLMWLGEDWDGAARGGEHWEVELMRPGLAMHGVGRRGLSGRRFGTG